MEDTKALRKRLDVIIRTLNERFAGDVVRHWFLRWAVYVWEEVWSAGRNGVGQGVPHEEHVIIVLRT